MKSIVAMEENEQLQIDLLDYSKYAKSNKNYSWILIGVDVFTRKGYAEPLKNKTPLLVLNAFKNLMLSLLLLYTMKAVNLKVRF